MIKASRLDYKKGYDKHYHTYLNCNDSSKISDISRMLMLIYCVECGLKSVLMERARIFNYYQAEENLQNLLASHNFEELLKNLSISVYRFPMFKTKYGDSITAKNYHQFCRYAVPTEDHSSNETYKNYLEEIADWLKEKV